MKVFITGGPRNGTTLFAHIVSAIGFVNVSKNLDNANAEDKFLQTLILEAITASATSAHDTQLKFAKINDYFSELAETYPHGDMYIKYPLLRSTLSIRPHLRVNKNSECYQAVMKAALSHFDAVIFIKRDSYKCAQSELKYLKELCLSAKIEFSQPDNFVNDYMVDHSSTFEYLSEVAAASGFENKLYTFSYEELLENPRVVPSRLGAILASDINPMITSIISEVILTRKKEERQALEIYFSLCVLLGKINNSLNKLNKSEIDYSQCMHQISSLQGVLADIE